MENYSRKDSLDEVLDLMEAAIAKLPVEEQEKRWAQIDSILKKYSPTAS